MRTFRFDQIAGALSKAEAVLESETPRLNIEPAEDYRCLFKAAGNRKGKRDRLESLPNLLPVTGLEQRAEGVVATGQRVGRAESHRSHRQTSQCQHIELQVAGGPSQLGDAFVRSDCTLEIRRRRGKAGMPFELMDQHCKSGRTHTRGDVV